MHRAEGQWVVGEQKKDRYLLVSLHEALLHRMSKCSLLKCLPPVSKMPDTICKLSVTCTWIIMLTFEIAFQNSNILFATRVIILVQSNCVEGTIHHTLIKCIHPSRKSSWILFGQYWSHLDQKFKGKCYHKCDSTNQPVLRWAMVMNLFAIIKKQHHQYHPTYSYHGPWCLLLYKGDGYPLVGSMSHFCSLLQSFYKLQQTLSLSAMTVYCKFHVF